MSNASPPRRREVLVTLVACALLGLEGVPGLLHTMTFVIDYRTGTRPFLLVLALGLVVGVLLGAVLLRQGGVSVPSSRERGATRGALAGLVLGMVLVVLYAAPPVSVLGFFSLAGLAVGRAFDSPLRRTS